MKKWMYLVFPGIMLALFLLVYTSHVKEAEERERQRIANVEAKRKADEEAKKVAEAKAAEDAKRVQAQREAEEKQKEDERRAKQEAADKKLADDTAEYRGKADNFSKQASQLEIELDRLRKQKDQIGREEFNLAKQVELARIAKQTAELKEQHLIQLIATKADASTLAQMPPPAPAK